MQQYVPDRVVSNQEIADALGLTPEQIFKSSGSRRRRSTWRWLMALVS
ncbi:MAG: hypothetical protein ACJ74J_22005 [Blastocatellia bacterium]